MSVRPTPAGPRRAAHMHVKIRSSRREDHVVAPLAQRCHDARRGRRVRSKDLQGRGVRVDGQHHLRPGLDCPTAHASKTWSGLRVRVWCLLLPLLFLCSAVTGKKINDAEHFETRSPHTHRWGSKPPATATQARTHSTHPSASRVGGVLLAAADDAAAWLMPQWRALFANPPAAECVGGCPCAQPRLPLVGRQENSERVVKRGASVQEVEARPSQAHVLRAGQGIGLRARQGEKAHELRFSQGPRVARCPREQVGRSADGGAQGRPHASADAAERDDGCMVEVLRDEAREILAPQHHPHGHFLEPKLFRITRH